MRLGETSRTQSENHTTRPLSHEKEITGFEPVTPNKINNFLEHQNKLFIYFFLVTPNKINNFLEHQNK